MLQALKFATILLASSAQLCLTSCEQFDANATECVAEIPPLMDSNATTVVLQMHQWVWVENLTAPDWGPRTHIGALYYEFPSPGIITNRTLELMVLAQSVTLSYATNGISLCAAALTQHTNRSAGEADRVHYSCSRICHDNFTSLGTRLNLPLLVYDNWVAGVRGSEYLAFDAVDPDSRAAYKCTHWFAPMPMLMLPENLDRAQSCRSGDVCLFNYNTGSDQATAGCKSEFQVTWCVSDMDLCGYNIDGECPVCCRGDLCNRDVAQEAYLRWKARMASSTLIPGTTTKGGAKCIGTPKQMLGVTALSIILLLQSL